MGLAEYFGAKVGDEFRMVEDYTDLRVGDIVYLHQDDGTKFPYFGRVCKDGSRVYGDGSTWCLGRGQITKLIINIKQEGDNNMSVSPREIKDLKLSENDRLLREAGFTTTDGSRTQDYTEILLDKLAEQYKDEIVNDLKTINKAKKATK